MNAGKFILLHDADNILVCRQLAHAGEVVMVDGNALTILHDIDIGHKVARFNLDVGEKIIKYGVSIGSSTEPVKAGDHVHLHNMQSDYIAPHDRKHLEDISKHK